MVESKRPLAYKRAMEGESISGLAGGSASQVNSFSVKHLLNLANPAEPQCMSLDTFPNHHQNSGQNNIMNYGTNMYSGLDLGNNCGVSQQCFAPATAMSAMGMTSLPSGVDHTLPHGFASCDYGGHYGNHASFPPPPSYTTLNDLSTPLNRLTAVTMDFPTSATVNAPSLRDRSVTEKSPYATGKFTYMFVILAMFKFNVVSTCSFPFNTL